MCTKRTTWGGGLHFLNHFIKTALRLITVGLITQTFLPALRTQVLTVCWNKGGSVQKHSGAKLLSALL